MHGSRESSEDMLGLAENLVLADVAFIAPVTYCGVLELGTIPFIKYRFMNSALGLAIAQVVIGGVLVFSSVYWWAAYEASRLD